MRINDWLLGVKAPFFYSLFCDYCVSVVHHNIVAYKIRLCVLDQVDCNTPFFCGSSIV